MSSLPVGYRFASFSVCPAEKQLLREGKPVRLAPKVYDTLLLLLESQGRLVEKNEFLKRLWPDSHVEEVALAHAISHLRKALQDGRDGSIFIETVPKRGYRFRVPVEVTGPAPGEATSRVTLGVLPVENLGPGSDHDYIAIGLTEEMIAVLGQMAVSRMTEAVVPRNVYLIAHELG
jgi:DNA-binding winged helix-turn-helix (wHTH) protein